jgi:hypothetical protein
MAVSILIIGVNTLRARDQLKPTTIEVLYENAAHWVEIEQSFNPPPNRGHLLPKVQRLQDSSISSWKRNEPPLVTTFLSDFVRLCKQYGMRRFYLKDSLTIAAVVTVLDLDDYRLPPKPQDTTKFARYRFIARQAKKGSRNWVRDALSILTDEVFFADLYAQSEQIKRRLEHCQEPEEEKLRLLALCRLDEKEREELLAREQLPLWARARHGDERAEKEIVNRLDAASRMRDYNFAIHAATNASLAGTDKCLKALMRTFEHDIHTFIRQGDSVVAVLSAHLPILKLLARHYPDEPLLHERLWAASVASTPDERKAAFFSDFSRWAERTYGIKAFDGFRPYLRIGCREDDVDPIGHCPGK